MSRLLHVVHVDTETTVNNRVISTYTVKTPYVCQGYYMQYILIQKVPTVNNRVISTYTVKTPYIDVNQTLYGKVCTQSYFNL